MRAGPLSDLRVISLLNRYFVPVYVSNEDYTPQGAAPPEEKAERNRILRESHQAKLSTGTVHAYVLTPDGHPIDSLHVATASKPERTVAMLEQTIEKLKVPEGKPLIPPVSQAAPPKGGADSLRLHLTARVLRGGAWGRFPAENWIVLDREQERKLLPVGAVAVGRSWQLDGDTAAKLLVHFYPATENNDLGKNRIDRQVLTARVVSVEDGVARARLDGSLKMKHPFYHKEDDKVVEASLAGYIDFDPAGQRLRALRLVTERATYGGGTFAVALRSVP
jgi:hypothetical protein